MVYIKQCKHPFGNPIAMLRIAGAFDILNAASVLLLMG